MAVIKVGKTTFLRRELEGVPTLEKATEKFKTMDREAVEIAWRIANPDKLKEAKASEAPKLDEKPEKK